MLRYFSDLFATDFLPHGVCMRWQPGVLWLHVVSDAFIALSYLCIPVLLIMVARKRKDVPFHWMFLAFGTFILACGATHALGIVTLWIPIYRLDGLVKAITALASVLTAVCLAGLFPTLLKIPTATQLEEMNRALAAEIAEKEKFAQALQASKDELKSRVDEQTIELTQVNAMLEGNIEAEKRTSRLLRERERQFKLACDFGQVATWTWDLDSGQFDTSSTTSGDHRVNDGYLVAVHPEDRQLVLERFENARQSASDFDVEYRTLGQDGSILWKAVRGSVERGKDGHCARMTGVNIDITARKEAEIAFEESVKQFGVLADTIPNLAWMANADGFIFWYNRRWYEYTGTTSEQMEGWGWQSVHDPNHLPIVMERWQASIRTARPFEMEFPLRSGEGAFYWFLTRVTPVLDGQGSVVRWFGTNTDVNEIRRVREALRESESQFRQMADALPQLAWIADANGSVLWFNQRWYEYTGSTSEQSLGTAWGQYFDPDFLGSLVRRWQHSLETGEDYEIEYVIRRFDGSSRWFLGRAQPVRSDDGSIVKWFGTCTDIEEYKRAEAEIHSLNENLEQRVAHRTEQLALANENLAETRAKLQAILDSATGVSIIATDTDEIIRIFNTGAERMLQYSVDEMVGVHTPEILHTEVEWQQLAALNAMLSRPVEDLESSSERDKLAADHGRECTYIRKDGSAISVYLTVSKVKNSAGAFTGLLGIATDISARKVLEIELRENNEKLQLESDRVVEANRAKSAFLAAMSHEIRTPMNAILGMSDLLWETELDEEQRKYVEVFRRAGKGLLVLINDILDLSKIEAGHFELDRVEFDLEDVIDRSIELIGPKAYSKGIGLLSHIASDLQTSRIGDPARLQQILVNLLGNAVKFTAKGQVVLSIVQRDSAWIECSVSDTGIGIAPEKQKSIFDDFTQADPDITRRFGGTGLGLGISRRLVTLMSGTLTVESTPGLGSTFRFSAQFPLGPQKTRNANRALEGLHGRRVLVVEGNSVDASILRETLSAWGMNSSEFPTAEQGATELARASSSNELYDLILLDRQSHRDPECHGLLALRGAGPGIPIVILSSDFRPGDASNCRLLGASAYAVKPVRRAELLKLICAALETPPPKNQERYLDQGRTPTRLEESSAALRILIAEDSPDNCALVKAYLKETPHVIDFVEDGMRAVEQFQSRNYDLILMDMQMPEMDGMTATRTIREIEAQQNRKPIPIVAITANALNRDVETSREAGCNAHLSKPISKEKLIGAIQQYGPRIPKSEDAAIWIEAPEGLEKLVPDYLANRKQEAQLLFEWMKSSDFAQIRRVAHDLKGTGESFGFPNLTQMGARMEKSAMDADVPNLERQLQELSHYLDRVQIQVPSEHRP